MRSPGASGATHVSPRTMHGCRTRPIHTAFPAASAKAKVARTVQWQQQGQRPCWPGPAGRQPEHAAGCRCGTHETVSCSGQSPPTSLLAGRSTQHSPAGWLPLPGWVGGCGAPSRIRPVGRGGREPPAGRPALHGGALSATHGNGSVRGAVDFFFPAESEERSERSFFFCRVV